MDNNKYKTARLIGKGLAMVQDGFDRVVAWGFGKLKDVDKNNENEENKIVKVAKQAGGFVGAAGSEFYKEYERLKTRRDDKKR